MLTTLVLNNSFEPIGFRSGERSLRLIFNEKVEVLEEWEECYHTVTDVFPVPAVVRFHRRVQHRPRRLHYHRKSILYRDGLTCQYCGLVGTKSQMSVDHIIPRVKGGIDDWLNCVTACKRCNEWKGSSSLEEAGMKLLKQPIIPNISIKDDITIQPFLHPSWKQYLG